MLLSVAFGSVAFRLCGAENVQNSQIGALTIVRQFSDSDLFDVIYFADDFPVAAILDESEHVGKLCFTELGVDAYDSYVGSDVARSDLV